MNSINIRTSSELKDIFKKYEIQIDKEDKDQFSDFIKRLLDSDVIVATPGSFYVIGEHSVVRGQPAMCMPIPLYAYVGIKDKKNITGLSIEIWSRNPDVEIIEKFKWEGWKKEELEEFILDALKVAKIEPQYDIFALIDIPLGCGLNSSGALSSAISLCINIIKNNISKKDVDKWEQDRNIEKLINDSKFKDVFKIARDIDRKIQEKSSGAGPFVSLAGTPGNPIVYLSTNSNEDSTFPSFFAANLFDGICDEVSREIVNNCGIALLYSGQVKYTRDTFGKMDDRSDAYSQSIIKLMCELNRYKMSSSMLSDTDINSPLKSFFDFHLEPDRLKKSSEYITDKILGILGGFSLIAISALIYNQKYVIDMMNVYQSICSTLNISTFEIDKICRDFQNIDNVGAKLTGAGGGGDVVIFSLNERSFERVKDLIERRGYTTHYISNKKYSKVNKILKPYFPITAQMEERLDELINPEDNQWEQKEIDNWNQEADSKTLINSQKELIKLIKDKEKLNWLDVGCGKNARSLAILERIKIGSCNIDYKGIDIDKKFISELNGRKDYFRDKYKINIEFNREDVSQLDCESKYDFITCILTTHELNPLRLPYAFKNMMSCLKDDGILILDDISGHFFNEKKVVIWDNNEITNILSNIFYNFSKFNWDFKDSDLYPKKINFYGYTIRKHDINNSFSKFIEDGYLEILNEKKRDLKMEKACIQQSLFERINELRKGSELSVKQSDEYDEMSKEIRRSLTINDLIEVSRLALISNQISFLNDILESYTIEEEELPPMIC